MFQLLHSEMVLGVGGAVDEEPGSWVWSHICCWLCDLGDVSCPLWACADSLPPSPCCLAFLPFDPSLASWEFPPTAWKEPISGQTSSSPRAAPSPCPDRTLPGLRKRGWEGMGRRWDRGSLLLEQRRTCSPEAAGVGRWGLGGAIGAAALGQQPWVQLSDLAAQ